MAQQFPRRKTDPARRAAYERHGWWNGDVVTARLAEHARSTPEKVAVVDNLDGGSYRYGELYRDVMTLAKALLQRGIGPGDVACLQLPNWYESAVVGLGCLAAGCVVSPLLPTYRQHELTTMYRAGEPTITFTPVEFRNGDFVPLVADVGELTDIRPLHVTVRGSVAGLPSLDELLDEGRQVEGVPDLPKRRDPKDVVEILFTSGTSAEPKAVLHSEEGLNFNMRSTAEWLSLGPETVVWMPSPIGHSTGFNYGIRIAAFHGWTLVLQDRWSPATAAELVAREGASFTLASTTFLHDLVDHLHQSTTSLPTLTHFGCGGAPVPRTLTKRANDVGITVLRLYGATEILNTTWNRRTDPLEKREDTDGPVMDGVEVRLLDDDGKEVATGVAGEITTRSPGTSVGYVNRAIDQAADGWFPTGDLATMDADGYMRIVGRKKEIIIRGGMNIAPAEIESLLLQIDGIRRASVIGIPDDRLGERVCACLIRDEGSRSTLPELTAELRARGLAVYKLPEAIAEVATMPTTASGKVRKDLLRAQVLADGLTEVRS